MDFKTEIRTIRRFFLRLFAQFEKTTLIVVGVLVLVRIFLPYGVKAYVNYALEKDAHYGGHVEDVDLHLWRGAYSVDEIEIFKKGGKGSVPFFEAPRVEFSISWRELLRGQIVARIEMLAPKVNFVDATDPQKKQSGQGMVVDQILDRLVPFRISKLDIKKGEIHFQNPDPRPPVDIYIREVIAELSNLTNSNKLSDELFATLKAKGITLGGGNFELGVKINPRAKTPVFDLKSRLLSINLTELNPFFKEYIKIDLEKGQGDIVTEMQAKDGRIAGYIKPLFRQLEIFDLDKEINRDRESVFRIAWEAIAGAVTSVFKNQPKDQFATRIPIQGKIDSPGTSVWTIIGGVLRNAFISALRPLYDGSVPFQQSPKTDR